MNARNRGCSISAAVSILLVAVAALPYLPSSFSSLESGGAAGGSTGNPQLIALGSVVIGIVVAVLIQQLTGYFTDTNFPPVKDVGKTSLTRAATLILSGISLGLESAGYSPL